MSSMKELIEQLDYCVDTLAHNTEQEIMELDDIRACGYELEKFLESKKRLENEILLLKGLNTFLEEDIEDMIMEDLEFEED